MFPALTLPIADEKTAIGITAGTVVLTLQGELPVEHLVPGDRIITRGTGLATLRDLRMTEVDSPLIRVRAGSLGHTRPERDTRIGPGTPVLIRDWRAQAIYGQQSAMVAAERLVDGEFIAREEVATVRLFTLVFDRAHVIYADGLEIGMEG